MSTPREGSDRVVLVALDEVDTGALPPDDGLDLGRPPRAPLRRRTRRLLAAGGAVLVAAAVTAVVLVRAGDDDRAPVAARTPTVESSAGFAAGPVLVTVGGRDALQAPGLPGLGASVDPVLLQPAPDVVAVATAALPNLRDVRGGRIPADVGGRNGFYVTGRYDAADGPTTVTLYSVRAPGTTYGSDQFVSRTLVDRAFSVKTDVSVFTGSGWWVHVVTLGPDDAAALQAGEVARLLPLASDPRLVAS